MFWIILPVLVCFLVLIGIRLHDIFCNQCNPISDSHFVEEEDEDMVSLTVNMKNEDYHSVEFRGDDSKYLDELLETLNEKKTGFIKVGDSLILNVEQISSIELD
jgi:hypothetical protein